MNEIFGLSHEPYNTHLILKNVDILPFSLMRKLEQHVCIKRKLNKAMIVYEKNKIIKIQLKGMGEKVTYKEREN